ncbi:flagellar biosynthesis protein FlaG [Pseudomonas sp. HMWF032]|uniref:flagellar protein FlaG n=1 Tax=unclassified Pseudomonas TaxID=196821 RepID=UPI000D368575|nr:MULTISPECIES: flagellar protein FlaG [unclassified Pseudomonas]PTS83628.1 flagellar biosynthesis protein FlaG [Pseudomonas sp. HMWF032]PTT84012.1 flagellar biosynthesis protein FlaG [Pseudomonas sp. HMWF010]WAC44864.1 flagellar protein FlaG [Pseudomonas sp. SL4(2022)]
MDISSIQVTSAPNVVASKAERAPSSSAKVTTDAVERKQAEEAAVATATKAESSPAASREEVEAAVATIQDFVQSVRRSLNFSLEEGSGRVVVKVTDAGSGDVIRQIPSEEALQLAENLSEVRSLLFKAEA